MNRNGVCLLFLNGPNEQLEFSLDGVFGRTGSKFEGFHSIPKGFHLISYRLTGRSNDDQDKFTGEGAFTSLVFNIEVEAERIVFIFEWNKEIEKFKFKTFIDSYEIENLYRYSGLIYYSDFTSAKESSFNKSQWDNCSSLITSNILKNTFKELSIIPDSLAKKTKKTIQFYEVTPMTESHHCLLKDLQIENENRSANQVLQFTIIPDLKDFLRKCSVAAYDSKIFTSCAMDRSPIFYGLNNITCINDLLGELQLSFILLTFAQNFEGFEQWLDIVSLLCQSFTLIENNVKEYNDFLMIIRDHLKLCPDDFFSGLMNENRLYSLFKGLFLNIKVSSEATKKFKLCCEKKFGWYFKESEDISYYDDDDENLPTIVDL